MTTVPFTLFASFRVEDGEFLIIIGLSGSQPCAETLCNESFYDWTGVGPIFDENFDGIRIMMEAQGITLENIGE